MDIVIDDGDHRQRTGNAKTLLSFWHIVKPGGYYVIEDISTGADNDDGVYNASGFAQATAT